jgi:hypothetical protein
MNEKKVPVLTETVNLAGPAREPALTLTDDELAELQARIATRGYALMEKLLHESLREMEANLFADVIGRLRSELPDLIEEALREQFAELPQRR